MNDQSKMNTFANIHTTRRGARITHLLLDVIQTVRAVDCEADEDDVRVGIAQGPQSMKYMKVASEAITKANSGSEIYRS